jgi:hypothetical protein
LRRHVRVAKPAGWHKVCSELQARISLDGYTRFSPSGSAKRPPDRAQGFGHRDGSVDVRRESWFSTEAALLKAPIASRRTAAARPERCAPAGLGDDDRFWR